MNKFTFYLHKITELMNKHSLLSTTQFWRHVDLFYNDGFAVKDSKGYGASRFYEIFSER